VQPTRSAKVRKYSTKERKTSINSKKQRTRPKNQDTRRNHGHKNNRPSKKSLHTPNPTNKIPPKPKRPKRHQPPQSKNQTQQKLHQLPKPTLNRQKKNHTQLTQKTNKKPGGQKNHKATTLTIPKNLDQLIKEGKAQKQIIDHTNGSQKYTTQWEIDIETNLIYKEHRHPTTEKPKIYYGENIKSLTVLLTNHGLISHNRPSDIFHDLSYGQITLSDATIEKFNHQAAAAVNIEALKTDLLNSPVLNIDETTLDCVERMEYGQTIPEIAVNSSFNAVIRTHSNNTTTLHTVNPHKDDTGVVGDGILTAYRGILVHDLDKKFFKYGSAHGACGTHLSRNLKGLGEFEEVRGWAERFRRFHGGMSVYKNQGNRLACGAA